MINPKNNWQPYRVLCLMVIQSSADCTESQSSVHTHTHTCSVYITFMQAGYTHSAPLFSLKCKKIPTYTGTHIHTQARPTWEDTHTRAQTYTFIHTQKRCLMIHEGASAGCSCNCYVHSRLYSCLSNYQAFVSSSWCLLSSREKAHWTSTTQSTQGQPQPYTT